MTQHSPRVIACIWLLCPRSNMSGSGASSSLLGQLWSSNSLMEVCGFPTTGKSVSDVCIGLQHNCVQTMPVPNWLAANARESYSPVSFTHQQEAGCAPVGPQPNHAAGLSARVSGLRGSQPENETPNHSQQLRHAPGFDHGTRHGGPYTGTPVEPGPAALHIPGCTPAYLAASPTTELPLRSQGQPPGHRFETRRRPGLLPLLLYHRIAHVLFAHLPCPSSNPSDRVFAALGSCCCVCTGKPWGFPRTEFNCLRDFPIP
jgi:hypothetical protein